MKVVQQLDSLQHLSDLIESVYFVLPSLLSVTFADPPRIEKVDGKVGSSSFRWELAVWAGTFKTTTQEEQEERFAEAWGRMSGIASPHRRRIVAGLHYYYVACRLAQSSSMPGEFVAEVLLNLSKSLEVLFPPEGDGQNRDAAREGLARLGYTRSQIECDFIPAMALRNEIDVGHVELGLFKPDHLKTIHSYTERAEKAFSQMFDRLIALIEKGEFEISPHELGPPRPESIRLIDRLRECEEAEDLG